MGAERVVLLLKNDEVRAACDMADAIEAMEAAFREEAEGGLIQPQRLNLRAGEPGKGFLRIMPVVMEKSGWMGFKAMNLAKDVGVRYQVHLYSMQDGALRAIMDAQYLTTVRTGATSAVATRRLARNRPGIVGVFGAGQEAEMQLEAMRILGLVKSARLYSPTPANREGLAQHFRAKHGMDIKTVASEREAVEGCDIVVAAINAPRPAILGAWLRPGMHVNSVGTARPTQREIDTEVYERSDIIVVDTRDGVFNEAGDAVEAKVTIKPETTHELAQLVGGTAPKRSRDDQITLFKSIGTAVQDVACAVKVYQNAVARGLGTEIEGFPYVLEKTRVYH